MTEKTRIPSPKNGQNPCFSRRDLDLARLEELLAEQCLPPEHDEDDGFVGEAEEVDLQEAVEVACLPRKKTAAPQAAADPAAGGAAKAKKSGSIAGRLIKLLLLLLALSALFVVGVLAGRGHIWPSGPGRELVGLIEQYTGQAPKAKKADPPADTNQTAGQADQTPADDTAAAASPATETGEEEMPVWDWPGWTPDDGLGDGQGDSASAVPDPAAAPDSAAVETEGDAAAVTPPAETAPPASAETAPTTPAGTETDSTADDSDGDVPEQWPTAIEPDQSGLYTPPSDEESVDYEAMLEASEVPDAPMTEAAPLPPAELSGSPGLGKFMVQVELAPNEAEAKSKVSQLTEQGFTAYYYQDGKKGYPVRVGHFATRQDADAAKVRLEELGYDEPSVSSLGSSGG